MLAGILLTALISVLMWHVPLSLGVGVRNAFVVTMMVLLFTFGYSLFTIPYTGQGYGMVTDYNERTHLFKWRQYSFAVAGFFSPWLPWLCIKLNVVFGGIPADKANGVYGVPWVGALVAVIVLLAAAAPIFGCREGQLTHEEQSKVRFRDAVTFTLTNRSFWPLVVANFLVKFGMVSTGIFFMYLLIYHVAGGDKAAGTAKWGLFCNVINVSTFIAMAPVVWMTDRIGKKPAMLLLMVTSAMAYASVWMTFQPTSGWTADVAAWISESVRFHVPWRQAVVAVPMAISKAWPVYVTAAGIGIFCNCMPMIMNSMLADVCDVDELKSGHQRQAFYGAVFVTCDKIAMGVAMFLQGFLLTISHFVPGVAVQEAGTIAFWLKALLFTQPTGFLLGVFCLLFYTITHAKAIETRRLLDERRKGFPRDR